MMSLAPILCVAVAIARHGLHHQPHAGSELPRRLLGRPQRRPRGRRGGASDVEHHSGGIRAELREPANRGLQACALGQALRGEPLLGVRRRLHGGGRGARVGGGEAVLQLRE